MNTNPTVSRYADRDKISVQPNTLAKVEEDGDAFKFTIISRGHYACESIKDAHIIIEKDGKIGCSCPDMTYRCTNNTVCKHIAVFLDLKVPPQTPASGELIKKLMLMGWVGGKDDLHPAEPEPYEKPDSALDQEIPETPEYPNEDCSNCTAEMTHYECPNCGESVNINADELADWILNHLDVCTGKHVPNASAQKTKTVGTCRPANIPAGSKIVEAGDPVPIEPQPDEEPNMIDTVAPIIPVDPHVPTNLATALCNMQKVDLLAAADSKNTFHSAKYADLASVWAAIRKPLTDNGLAVMQTTEPYKNGITVVTTLLHTSGESFTARLSCEVPESKPDKNGQTKPNIQGLGSTITYLRRYSLIAMVGVAPVDDDGEAAMGR